MADKPEFVDMISEATRQSQAQRLAHVDLVAAAPKETSRLSQLAPEHGRNGGWKR